VLLVPGLVLLKLLRVQARWDQRIVLGFAFSYSWFFVLSIVLPLFQLNVDVAAFLTLMLVCILGFAVARAKSDADDLVRSTARIETVLLALLVIIGAFAGWIIEPPFTGEEALDLASMSRFADGGRITFENTSLMPDTRPVYLVQPYQLALGMVARWSGTEPLVALVKFRAFLIPLALALMYSLLRSLTLTRVEALSAFVVVLLFVGLDMNTWEWNSLFPFVRRGGMGAGICVPVLLVLFLTATRSAGDPHAHRLRRVALLTAPAMLLASLATHPLEMFTLLCFATGLTLAILVGVDATGDRTHAVLLMLLLVAATGAYIAVQAEAVPYVAEYERGDKLGLRADLVRLAGEPTTALLGGPTEAREILSRTVPATSALVAGIPALAIAVLRAPAAAAVLALGVVPLALMYASPAGYVVLTLLTSVETVRDVGAYFALLTVVALAIGLTTLVQASLNAARWWRNDFTGTIVASAAGSVVVWTAWKWGRLAVQWLANRTIVQPEILLVSGLVALAAVLIAASLWRRSLIPPASSPVGVVLATACLAVPFAVPEWGFGGIFTKRDPVTILDRIEHRPPAPSVLDWPSYYEELKQSIAPPLPMPRAVVDELRRRLAPRQVVLADPRYSCALVALIDAYCINPESIYGHYFQPAARYHAEYVKHGGKGASEHPFFNASSSLSDAEERLLREYHVSYVITDPAYSDQTSMKLRQLGTRATLEADLYGYQLYRISGP
jgi:hypothetical protein